MKAASNGPMADTLRESSRMVSCMVTEHMSGKMEGVMKASISKIRNMDLELTHTRMEANIEETG